MGATYQYTSFEEPAAVDCSATSQNDCANVATISLRADCAADGAPVPCPIPSLAGIADSNSGTPVANGGSGYVTAFASTGNELGFTTYWEACTGDNTGTSGIMCDYDGDDRDNIGVVSNSEWGAGGDNGADVLHGSQCFMIDDADGFAYATLDPVDLAAMATPVVSIWTHIDSTGYEDKDAIRIWATCADGSTIDVVAGVLDDNAHPTGADGQQLTENLWVPHIASLAGCGTATLSFGCQTNSNSEECWFDVIEFYDAAGDSGGGGASDANVWISELHYNPAGSQGPDSQYEYTELYNGGGAAADMSGWTLTGHNLEFPAGTTLAPGEYLLVVRNVDAITAIAPSGT